MLIFRIFRKLLPSHIYYILSCRPWIKDEKYLKLLYKKKTGKELNLKDPETFNEKLQWLKLHDKNPAYTNLVDKYEAKKTVASIIGEEHIIQTLGIWNSFDEIDFDSLPQKFVLKLTHDSGGVFICEDKNTLDLKKLKKKINTLMKKNYYWLCREWPYKNIKPRIMAEELMIDESGTELKDYKIFTFNGVPKLIQVHFGRFADHKSNMYDFDWNPVNMYINYPCDYSVDIPKPVVLDELQEYASTLSKGIPQLRTDFYVIRDKIYFGELTFYHSAGMGKFNPAEWDKILGDWIDLTKLKSNK